MTTEERRALAMERLDQLERTVSQIAGHLPLGDDPGVDKGVLYAALSELQKDLPSVRKSKAVNIRGGASYSYATLHDLLEALRPKLSAQGLSIHFSLSSHDGLVRVTGVLAHSSGASIRSWLEGRPEGRMSSVQAMGSMITYFKRYVLTSLVGIEPEEDDDGQGAAPMPQQRQDDLPRGQGAERRAPPGRVPPGREEPPPREDDEIPF